MSQNRNQVSGERLWDEFATSGSIDAYLAYKQFADNHSDQNMVDKRSAYLEYF